MNDIEFWPSIPGGIATLVPEEINQHILLFLGAGTWWQLACKRWHTTFQELKRLGRFEPPGEGLSKQIEKACRAGHLARFRVLEARERAGGTELSPTIKEERFMAACHGGNVEVLRGYLPESNPGHWGNPENRYMYGMNVAARKGRWGLVVFLDERHPRPGRKHLRGTAQIAARHQRETFVNHILAAAPADLGNSRRRQLLEKKVLLGAIESCRVEWLERVMARFGRGGRTKSRPALKMPCPFRIVCWAWA